MVKTTLKDAIRQALTNFSHVSTSEGVKHLFETLGYSTQREIDLDTHTPDEVVEVFGWENFREDKGLLGEWESVDCLFQVTEDEITENPQLGLFQPSLAKDYLSSYVFMGLTLQNPSYSRSQLAGITREVNRQSDIPIMVLFRYGEAATLSIINRRPNQKDRDKDVLEKVTLIKDININSPHRAHIEILSDLALVSLKNVRNFDELHTAWQKVLDTSELNKRFFQEVSNWYFWAISTVRFPDGAEKDEHIRNATSVIRLITRLIFVWFLKEKGLVPDALFDENELKRLLKSLESDESTYYKAILQNLFFATLNTEMNDPPSPLTPLSKGGNMKNNRKFRGKTTQKGGRDQHYGIANVYRYQDYFVNSDDFLGLCSNIPFLNGGLFECLDRDKDSKDSSQSSGKGKEKGKIRIDGFSDRKDNPLSLPNVLFFGEERDVDLNKIYGTRNKKYKVQGLIEIFNRYKFTIDENTPIEEEIALDPELLGKVFENLLAEYNPETETTARKQTGSFYTPREIVNYMVDESLIAYLENALLNEPTGFMELGSSQPNLFGNDYSKGQLNLQMPIDASPYQGKEDELDSNLRHLLSYSDKIHQFNDKEVEYLINAIDNVKIIDIACGSGAFPMGILQKLVFILGKLDPNNSKWKQKQKEKAIQPVLKDIQVAKQISYEEAREEAIEKLEERLTEIEREFDNNEMDYPRKLFLIENCIFGVDIQPIAVQIAKLRFFISLIVDQKVNDNQPNRGILPLPNLETKFVAANSLIGIETQLTLRSQAVIDKEKELKKVRQQHFTARTPKTKKKCREKDEALRQEISELLKSTGLETATADTLARWNPYDLNASSDFFDAEWMFGVSSFDICIGNPPYVRQEKIRELKPIFKKQYDCYTGVADLYVYFFEKGVKLLQNKGILCYISSNKYFRSGYGQKLREFLGKQTQLQQLIDFCDAPVFTAIAYPSIIITQVEQASSLLKSSPHKQDACDTVRVLNWEMGKPIDNFIEIFKQESFTIEQKALKSDGWRLESNTVLQLLEKLRKAGTPLGEYVNGRFYYGIKTGFNEAFIVDTKTRDQLIAEHPSSEEVLKPFLRGKDVKRWVVKNPDLWLIFTRRGIDINQYPAILKYLIQYQERLTPGIKGGRKAGSYKWYEIQDNIAYYKEFDTPKILYQEIATYQAFSWDISGSYSNNKTFLIPDANLILLSLLNAKVIWFFLSHITSKLQGGAFAMQTPYVSQIPIPKPTDTQDACVTEIVNKILETKRQNPQADTSDLEREIDEIVYQLYGLTEEEITIIEESVKRT